ncbi:Fe-S cluster assembly protein SufB OS=Lysinibacillus sphaericus OX=1421 GN=sufB_2 PE=3 SV=1 [Lysinibacillus sphaericus]
MKQEPEWMLEYRLKALELSIQNHAQWGGDLGDLDFDELRTT